MNEEKTPAESPPKKTNLPEDKKPQDFQELSEEQLGGVSGGKKDYLPI